MQQLIRILYEKCKFIIHDQTKVFVRGSIGIGCILFPIFSKLPFFLSNIYVGFVLKTGGVIIASVIGGLATAFGTSWWKHRLEEKVFPKKKEKLTKNGKEKAA